MKHIHDILWVSIIPFVSAALTTLFIVFEINTLHVKALEAHKDKRIQHYNQQVFCETDKRQNPLRLPSASAYYQDDLIVFSLHDLFFVPATVNGKNMQLLIDTGAAMTVIPRDLITDSLDLGRPVIMGSHQGEGMGVMCRVNHLEIGHFTWNNQWVICAKSHLDNSQGVLGMDILQGLDIHMNHERAFLRKRKD